MAGGPRAAATAQRTAGSHYTKSRPETLFYCDPPYWGCETDYGKGVFAREDFTELAEVLRSLRRRFVLSINDVPEIRELFSWAHIEEVRTTYTISSRAAKPAGELIITTP